jgi:hypothetical protein
MSQFLKHFLKIELNKILRVLIVLTAYLKQIIIL